MRQPSIDPLDTPEAIADLADMLSQIENAEQLAELLTVPEFTRSRLNRADSLTPPVESAADKTVGYRKPSKTRNGISLLIF